MIPETSAGEIDYLAHWRNLVEARVDQGRRLDLQHGRADEWAGDRASRFRRIVAHTFHDDPLSGHLRTLLRPADVLLDVGAGPGRHAIPLANLVRRVIAVEPSAAMRSHLIDGIDRAGQPNVDVVAAGWPEAEVAPADVVICSHVVYGIADLGPFLQKLDTVARRHCAMVLRYGQREEPILDLFRQIWGERRCLAPTCLDLLGAVAQLGIRANLTVVPFGAGYHFASLDEAV
ncbi:MAG TPA: methyltransferase domain-containing protein, partial [Chloroflexota bacterium]|nr:methyltransferase domain-containing protein [Chloroflexota bacterium]